uniref:uncharacterized protein C11orf96-like n=1 Tax=Callithrix jacchus TaxID=9483 RepID=UPI0023DD393F|nr:uncharacterized protein C11orf96-like [Callithrix jacchus]
MRGGRGTACPTVSAGLAGLETKTLPGSPEGRGPGAPGGRLRTAQPGAGRLAIWRTPAPRAHLGARTPARPWTTPHPQPREGAKAAAAAAARVPRAPPALPGPWPQRAPPAALPRPRRPAPPGASAGSPAAGPPGAAPPSEPAHPRPQESPETPPRQLTGRTPDPPRGDGPARYFLLLCSLKQVLGSYPIWWSLAVWPQYSSLGLQPIRCASIPGLVPKQLHFCRNYVIMPSVAKGIKIGIQECQHQFQGRWWNCTTIHDSLAIFGPVLDKALQVLRVQTVQRLHRLPGDASAQVPLLDGACPATQEDAGSVSEPHYIQKHGRAHI